MIYLTRQSMVCFLNIAKILFWTDVISPLKFLFLFLFLQIVLEEEYLLSFQI